MTQATRELERPEPAHHRRLVAVTFDDAYADFYTHAMPALMATGAQATLFVPTAHVERTARWLPSGESHRPLLGWTAISDITATGVEIGSHGHQHAPLDLGSPDAIHDDLRVSRLMLEDKLARNITTLAYPYGYQTAKTRRAARRAGYHAACTVIGLSAETGDSRLALPRIAVTEDLTGPDLVALLDRQPRRGERPFRIGKQRLWHAARKTRLIGPLGLSQT
jgi:peptidoglycan/xylan/chitin deacetylase (PgdA/CDA1 family)